MIDQLLYETEKKTRRGKAEIILDIFEILSVKERKFTHLLYKSNLSCERLKYYLAELTDKGLVREQQNANGTFYHLTQDGFEAHAQYRPFGTFIKELAV
jgi:predicted transcriptional regulator